MTPRLNYRQPLASDLARLYAIYSDPQTQQFNPAGPLTSLAQAQQLLDQWLAHWAEHGHGWWAISTSQAPEHIIGFGGVAAHDYLGERRMNLGYRFAVDAWGHGYATELGHEALGYAIDQLGLAQVFALVRPDHGASIRVLEKIGMQPVGELDDVPGKAPSLVFQIKHGNV